MGICEFCGKGVTIPFKCSYCGQLLCGDHRLPENHKCMYRDIARGKSEVFVVEKNVFKSTKEWR